MQYHQLQDLQNGEGKDIENSGSQVFFQGSNKKLKNKNHLKNILTKNN